MNLIKDVWTKSDIDQFQEYLISLENNDKKKWTASIVNTKLPVLAIKSPILKDIVKKIMQGNYLSFLDLMNWQYHENTTINGLIISKIKDFDILKKYLDIYSLKADNWATCDVLSFNIKNNEDKFLNLAKLYVKHKETFVRRIGVVILFNFVKEEKYLDEIFEIISSMQNEKQYYVNMINAWIVCECFIKHRQQTILFLDKNKLNTFTINKAISKCRDSYRVSIDDKEMLKKYKR